MTRISLLFVVCALLVACRDVGSPTDLLAPADVPVAAVSDGNHGGNARFFFLPPLVQQSKGRTEKNNRSVSPTVTICDAWDDAGCVGSPLATVTRASGTHGMRLADSDAHFGTEWRTSAFPGVDPGEVYRIHVHMGATRLGFLDVEMIANARDRRSVSSGAVPVVAGSAVPIRFRVESGALAAALGEECELECTEATVTGGEETIVVAESGESGILIPEDAVEEGEEVTISFSRLTVDPCLPTEWEQFQGCYRYDHDQGAGFTFQTDVGIAMCLEPAGQPIQDQLQMYKAAEVDGDAVPPITGLPVTAENFLNCEDFAANPNSLLGRLARSPLGTLLRPVARAVAPGLLYAEDLGLMGLDDSFSRFGWVRPIQLEGVSGGDQTAEPGETLPDPIVVLAEAFVQTTSHPEETPAGGVPLTITFSDPDGNVVGTQNATTGADGTASVSWTLTAAAGTHTAVVTGPRKDALTAPPSATFTATAEVPVGTRTTLRVAGIGANRGATEADAVFSSGDLPGTINRLTEAEFNALSTADLIATYDVLLFTWSSCDGSSCLVGAEDLDGDWATRIKPFLDAGGGVIWEDEQNAAAGDLEPAVSAKLHNRGGGLWEIAAVPGITDGISAEFTNNHFAATSWSADFQPFLWLTGLLTGDVREVVGLYAEFAGGGRMIVTGPDQDWHAHRNGSGAELNQYNLLVNELRWVGRLAPAIAAGPTTSSAALGWSATAGPRTWLQTEEGSPQRRSERVRR